ncbi:hypothetical protein PPL_08504 [Heterostelium album PN500]|uniref:COI1 F-box domain-containing protein n=1 Tax=Heterostelium pallidum (strain ATCC 26659 / Pp 5 / PN500) TaxID=670386 RepID=D3BID4_HETP5|nr:hypothetical protein PPL_08504 [Heterostelium album PN500]EFA79034.1 hypothetical protein PPL_08504 [Heterostelium album PN500]|eukprot:XP_020431157.1 hypothetical protein PPL_08504 [Heterostelium album PN500]
MIINLSHILLSKIISYLEDNIDRLCVSLVCKRWFDERDKYLYFNTDRININLCKDIDDHHDHSNNESEIEEKQYNIKCLFSLESYRSSILRSLNQKNNCTLAYSRDFYLSDYSVNPYSYPEDDRIISNITKVILDEQLDNKYLKEIYGMISISNVSTLKGITSLSSVLPVNLTSITFHEEFDEVLLAGYLPPKLEKLKFEWNSEFNQVIAAGVLPNTLKKLRFGDDFNQQLEPHVLPSSLTYLKLGGEYTQTLQVGSLPPNLRALNCYCICMISDGVLPQSLCTLTESPLSWIPFIKSLNNLTTLSLYNKKNDDSNSTLNLADLPTSLTSLSIDTSCRLISSLSPSIRFLDIHLTDYDIDEIFKDRSQYHFERLCVDGLKQESLDNLKIKELKLQFLTNESIIRDIPFGVETLDFGYDIYHFQIIKRIPNGVPLSVKKIIFQFNTTINQLDFEIPNSVEEVVIKYYYLKYQFPSKLIPNSVRSMTVPSEMIPNVDIFDIPKSVTSLCFIDSYQKVDLHVRMIYDDRYLIFGQSFNKFSVAIVPRILPQFIR